MSECFLQGGRLLAFGRGRYATDAQNVLVVGQNESEQISNAALAIDERLRRGGKLILFGNGGSATDAKRLGDRLHSAADRLSAHYRWVAVQ